ncbi:MAG: GNAT family N-acetyltransferase [Anaerolineales bacterium]|jgi:ribosomal protein S18 acetylase RimI-like enzyme
MKLDRSYSFHEGASQEEVDLLWQGIIEYNKTSGPMLEYPPYEPYRIVLKDGQDQVVAGILTKIYLRCMAVELLWIDKELRNQGIGSELLHRVESHARELGCTFIHLDTFSFQAIEFYRKHGFSVFGLIDDYPGNVARYYLKKEL